MTRLFCHAIKLWVWPIIILTFTLLPAPAIGMQCDTPEYKTNRYEAFSDVLDDIAVLWLHVIQNGKRQKQAFSKKDIAKTSVLSVDGYVNGVVLLTTAPIQANLDKSPLEPIQITPKGNYKLKYFGYLDQKGFRSKFLNDTNVLSDSKMIKGRYCRFSQVPGDMLSTDSEFTIGMNKNGVDYQLTVRQSPAVKLEVSHEQKTGNAFPNFYYMGTPPDQFSATSAAFKERLKSVVSGIQNIESAFDTRLVNQVRIIDFDGPHNAYTCLNKSNIWLYRSIFENESLDELKNIAEHETLHIISDRLGLPASHTMRDRYAQLLGYAVGSEPYNFIVSTGRGLKKDPTVYRNPLFDFINEANFIAGAKGGHSIDNIDEFCTSFLHTLVYIDRWEKRVAAPLQLPDNSQIKLSNCEKKRLYEDYQTVLSTMIQDMSQRVHEGYLTFFKESSKKIHSPRAAAKAQIISSSTEKAGYTVD